MPTLYNVSLIASITISSYVLVNATSEDGACKEAIAVQPTLMWTYGKSIIGVYLGPVKRVWASKHSLIKNENGTYAYDVSLTSQVTITAGSPSNPITVEAEHADDAVTITKMVKQPHLIPWKFGDFPVEYRGPSTGGWAIPIVSLMTIIPSNPSVHPLGHIQFIVTDNLSSSHMWKLSTDNSGGRINSKTGLYYAGEIGSQLDTIEVINSFGNVETTGVVVTASIQIIPSTTLQASIGQLDFTFTAVGGTGPYVFSLTTDISGSSITSGGVYTVGVTPGVDVVTVTDSIGSTSSVSVNVSQT